LLILFFYYWADWEFSFLIFFFKTLDWYNVSLHGFLLNIFFQNYLCQFFFILSWLRIELCSYLKQCRLLQCFPTWFLPCYSVSPHVFLIDVFFPNIFLSNLFFSYWAGWQFSFFFLKHRWLLQCFSIWFFLCFFKLSLSFLLLLILSWLRITAVDFLMKHYRLL